MIAVFAGLVLVAVWTGLAAILGFNRTVVLTTTVSTILASMSALAILTMVVGTVIIRKA
jgi:hypothetical protein